MSAEEFTARTVRPYAVTGGRVRVAGPALPLEALVTALEGAVPDGRAAVGLTPERRAVLAHAARTFVSVAELSALLHLPLGVTRVVVADMATAGLVDVHTSSIPTDFSSRTGAAARGDDDLAASFSLLESVLNGISAL